MLVAIYVKAGSSVNRVGGNYDDRLVVSVTAKAVDGAANLAVIATMAKVLNVPKKTIRIHSGLTSKRKMLEIDEDFVSAVTNLRFQD